MSHERFSPNRRQPDSPSDPCVDQPVIQPLLSFRVVKYLWSQTESLENAGSERVDEDISLGDETFGGCESIWILCIEHDRAFSFAKRVVGGRGGRSVDARDRGAMVCENETGEWGWRQSRELLGRPVNERTSDGG